MRKSKIGRWGPLLAILFLAVSLAASCSGLRARNDEAITTDIKAKMSSEPLLKNASLDVSTHGGVVTLAGGVPDDAAHLAAYKIATAEKGVTRVNDQINVAIAPAEPGLAVSTSEPAAPASRPTRPSRSSRAEEARRGSERVPASGACN